MGLTKRMLEKEYDLTFRARTFLIDNDFIEVALDGTLHSEHSSNESLIYIKSNQYFKESNLHESFSLKEFRDRIKSILDESISGNAFDYDLDRID